MSRDRIDLLLKLMDYSWETEGWFPSLAVSLEGVGPAEAAWQGPGSGNTIWQTVNHMNYYNDRLLCRLTNIPFAELPSNDATFGESGNPEDTAGWQAAVQRTRRVTEGLRKALAERTDADLDQGTSSATLGDGLTAWIMHDAYHTGQILLIRKQQGSWPARRG